MKLTGLRSPMSGVVACDIGPPAPPAGGSAGRQLIAWSGRRQGESGADGGSAWI
jgi:hypothetical protein